MVEEKSCAGLGKESERRERERERGEVGRWGELWRVRREGAASCAPSPGV
jgi:hypothetical protein